MKKVLVLLLLAPTLSWAGTLSLATTGQQDKVLERMLASTNASICASLELPAGCTNAQVQEKNPKMVLVPDVSALASTLLASTLRQVELKQQEEDQASFDTAWSKASAEDQNKVCKALGLQDGCKPQGSKAAAAGPRPGGPGPRRPGGPNR